MPLPTGRAPRRVAADTTAGVAPDRSPRMCTAAGAGLGCRDVAPLRRAPPCEGADPPPPGDAATRAPTAKGSGAAARRGARPPETTPVAATATIARIMDDATSD